MTETAAKPALRRGAFSLDQPGQVWLVRSGYLDLFAIAQEGMPDAGALQHVARADAQQLVMASGSVEVAGVRFDLIAVPSPGANVTRDSWEGFGLLAQQADPAWQPSALVLQSVWQWGTQLPQDGRPDAFTHLRSGEQLVLEPQAHAACDTGVVLVELTQGEAALQGNMENTLAAGTQILLSKHAWLSAKSRTELRVWAYESLYDPQDLLAAYSGYFHAHIALMCAAMVLRGGEEAQRLQKRIEHTEKSLAEGMHKMAQLLDKRAAPPSQKVSAEELVLETCMLLGREQGIEFKRPIDPAADVPALVSAIADVSGVRVRQVTLSGEWWKLDDGPMLAFAAETETPLALLPGKGRRYELHDRLQGGATPVTGKIAAGLKPFAYLFYRPLPNKPLNLSDLLRFGLHGLKREALFIAAFAGAMGLLSLAGPLASAALIDNIIPSAQINLLIEVAVLLVVIALTRSLFSLARSLFVLRVQDRMDLSIQAAIWDRVLNLPMTFFRNYSVGDLTARVSSINAIHRMLSVGTMTGVLNGVFSLLSFIVLFRFNAMLALLALVLVAGAAAALLVFGYLTLRVLKNTVASQRRITNLILQFLQGVAKLRTTASEARAFAIWAKESAHMRQIRLKTLNLRTAESVFFAGYEHIGTLLLFGAMGSMLAATQHNPLSAGEFIGFYFAFGNVFQGVLGLCQTLVALMNIVPLYQMAKPLLETMPETSTGKADPGRLSGAIEGSRLYFRYPDSDTPILADVSFYVRPGSFTAIVGPSGSGKSTLLRLLLGFDTPSSGAILYDDKNLQDLNLRAVRKQFGVVLQNSQLMAGDIYSNIIGTANASLDEAWDAARQSGLDEDIQRMPMGMHTAIGEGSSTLSGGQRQRILISRALIGRPRVLFFDEATSALDNRSQAVVSESLLRLKTTRIVVAHRLSTIVYADQILVMDQGRVVQCGTYQELIAQPGLFADLARRQMMEEG
ncbi:MAG: NHLP bacteriocin export ABC transporter permease/ATPase subunit [Burkholderiales bacterium]|jgi:ATP-binding cassette subfamily C protein